LFFVRGHSWLIQRFPSLVRFEDCLNFLIYLPCGLFCKLCNYHL
jgi:hypothetical protein